MVGRTELKGSASMGSIADPSYLKVLPLEMELPFTSLLLSDPSDLVINILKLEKRSK